MITPPFDLSKCHPVCHECVKRYNEKYANKTNTWDINCSGIPKTPEALLPEELIKTTPKELIKQLIATQDPIEWAKSELKWEPRWYQEQMIRCDANRKVSRCGRQIGKCLDGDTRIYLADGDIFPIKELVGQTVEVLSLSGEKIVTKKANVFKNIEKECVELKFKSGRRLIASTDHPIMLKEEWREAGDLLIGDEVVALGDTPNIISTDEVVDIIPAGIRQTYDLSIIEPKDYDDANFCAEGIFVHNTESLAVTALFHAVTKKNFHVVVLSPMKTHTEVLFKRIEELMSESVPLKNSIVRKIKSPIFTIEFSNGSSIEGFTSGEKSGGEADVVRGRSVNLLIFDEADMLSPATFDSSLATVINFPDAMIWVSSTPKGKKERFYKCCVESSDFEEFHFPSQVNPNWTDEMERLFREQLTEIGYKQEILADFATQVEGVFQRKYVENAMVDYSYSNETPKPGWIYCVGVDWNDMEIGTRIRVVGFNPATGKFRVVDKATVSREGWNQVAAMRKIRDINRIWHPSWIYVDNRPSPAHVEMLKLYGVEAAKDPQRGPSHPDARLKDIVVGYEFGGKVETHDVFTKEKVKRHAKVFLIENAVRRFEAGQVEFSKEDKELEAQLLGYIIDHYTTAGIPVYKAGNEEAGDHDIDALSLALVGFTLEMTILGRPKWSGTIGLVDRPLDAIVNGGPREDDEKIPSVARAKKKETLKEKRRKMAPNKDRFDMDDRPYGVNLPAANVNMTGRRLWSWPGFGRDAPKPTRQANQSRLLGKGPPQRKNI